MSLSNRIMAKKFGQQGFDGTITMMIPGKELRQLSK